ncbi:CASR protein, partial [Polypterus senegalus]
MKEDITENCKGPPPVLAIVGDPTSTHSIAISRILSLFQIPMVSYFATCPCLSDKWEYPTFFRTIPSDTFQIKVISAIFKHYGWTWVGIIAADDDYGQSAIKALSEEIKDFACIAFSITIPKINDIDKVRHVTKMIKESSAKVIVVFSPAPDFSTLADEINQQNIIGRQWIASESWSNSYDLFEKYNFSTFGGTLGERVAFDENGDALAIYDIVNWQQSDHGTLKTVTVGFYAESAPAGHELSLKDDDIIWNINTGKTVQAMVFAIEEINKDDRLLPNITMGYSLYDNCMKLPVALSAAAALIGGLDENILDYYCAGLPPVLAIIGDPASTHSIAISRILSLFGIPLISYYATCPCLSNKQEYPSFFRTIPSDAFQVMAIRDILRHYGWTWVGVVASDDDYGQYAVKTFSEEIKNFACIAFTEIIPKINENLKVSKIANTIRESSAKVIVVFSSGSDLISLVKEIIHQNITGKQWIASEAWSTSHVLITMDIFKIFGGTLGISIHKGEISGFQEFLYKINKDPTLLPNLTLGYRLYDNCVKLPLALRAATTLIGGMEDVIIDYDCEGLPPVVAIVGDPVSTHSIAISRILGLFGMPLLLHYLKKVNFTNHLGERIAFDENGDVLGIYDIINWQQGDDGIVTIKNVGVFDKSAVASQELYLDEKEIFWNFEPRKISYYATCACLSNKQEHPSFFRTIPSDTFQVKAMIEILKHFGWTWVGAIASEDDYGQNAMAELSEQIKSIGCLSFIETIPKVNQKMKIIKILETIKISTVNVIIVFASGVDISALVKEVVSNNITGKQWIASDAWSTTHSLATKENFASFGGTIGITVRRGEIPGLENFLVQLHPNTYPNNTLIIQFWEAMFGCTFQQNINNQTSSSLGPNKICTGDEDIQSKTTPYSDVSQLRGSYNVYKAVYALGYALHNAMNCEYGKGPFMNNSCVDVTSMQPWQLFHYLKYVNFTNHLGERVAFDKNGDVLAVYDILNWQWDEDGSVKIKTVGLFDMTASSGKELLMNESNIFWNFDSRKRAQTMVFAIEEINKDPHLLPNITLGYILYDNCVKLPVSLRAATALIGGLDRVITDYNCQGLPPVLAIVGDPTSTNSIAISRLLGVFHIPMLLHYLRHVNFTNHLGETVAFDENGDVLGIYDVVNWQWTAGGYVKIQTIGSFDQSSTHGKGLFLNESNIQWNFDSGQVPVSVCSNSCQPGTRKAFRKGEPICCFDCIPCADGEISTHTDSIECIQCPHDQWSNPGRNCCLLKEVDPHMLLYGDVSFVLQDMQRKEWYREVSYYATCPCLSNKKEYPSFFRTIPSDTFQVKAMVKIIKHYGWTWVGALASNDDYGLYALKIFNEEVNKFGCISFTEIIPNPSEEKKLLQVARIIKTSTAKVIVAFSGGANLFPLAKEIVRQNITGRQWIASESWSFPVEIATKENFGSYGDRIAFDENGDAIGIYDIVNWQLTADGNVEIKTVGVFDESAPSGKELFLEEDQIFWNFDSGKWVQTMVFAIEEINKDPALLPNISLGYRLYDNCVNLGVALKAATSLIAGEDDTILDYSCQGLPPVVAIVGDPGSTHSIAILSILGLFNIPLVSYYATCSCLSNKYEYPTFFRTIPSDAFQVKAMAEIIKHYGWTWVGALASDDDYGQNAIKFFKEEINTFGCIAFMEAIPKIHQKDVIQNIVKTIKQSSAKIIVAFCSEVELLAVVKKVVNQNITGRQWIASEGWSTSTVLASNNYFGSFGGTLGIAIRRGEIPGLGQFLLQIQPEFNNNLFIQFWETVFGCKFQTKVNYSVANGPACTGFEIIQKTQTAFNDVSELRASYNVYKAVYTLAHALHDLASCIGGNGPFENNTCADIRSMKQWQLLYYLKKVNFTNKLGERLAFDDNGDALAIYDIVNWQQAEDGSVKIRTIGIFDKSANADKELVLDEDNIFWNFELGNIPESYCSKSCLQGTRKAIRKGEPVCCFDCIPCADGEISSEIGYQIYDNCAILPVALRAAASLLGGLEYVISDEECKGRPPVLAIIGDPASTNSIAISRILNPFQVPQVSYSASCSCLSNKQEYPSFFRTMPSDAFQVKAIVHIVKHYGWSWIGCIASEDDYGQNAIKSFIEEAEKFGCIAFKETIPKTNAAQEISQIVKIIKESTAKVIVIFSADTDFMDLAQEIVRQNVTGKQWIASEGWSTSTVLTVPENMITLGGTIGIAVRRGEIPGLQYFLLQVQPDFASNNQIVNKFWETMFECKFQDNLYGKSPLLLSGDQCTGHEDMKTTKTAYSDVSHLRVAYNIYKAVYALAHALHSLSSCENGKGPFEYNTCASIENAQPWQEVNFVNQLGERVAFDKNGDALAIYDIINWQQLDDGTINLKAIGVFDESAPVGQELLLNKENMFWNFESGQIPKSVCSESCLPGFRKAIRKGQPICCFDCISCADGEISTEIGRLELSVFQWAQTMIFAIEEINRNENILPNVTLGYRIYDNCVKLPVALRVAAALISGNTEVAGGSDCEGTPPVIAIIGDPVSTHSIAISRMLSLFQIPMVSYSASCSCLSNKQEFPTFFRTIPSDAFQVKAMIEIIKHYGWTWVGAIASDDDYGQNAIKIFQEDVKAFGCIAFSETIHKVSEKDDVLQIVKVIKNSSAKVIVAFSSEVELKALMDEIVRQNITGRQWIASEGWSTAGALVINKNYASFGGTIGIAFRRGKIQGLQDFLLQIHLDFDPKNNLVVQFWETIFQCKFEENIKENMSNRSLNVKLCSGHEDVKSTNTAYSDVSDLRNAYNVYKAVYAVAHALDNMMRCVDKKGPFANNVCADIQNVQPWQVSYYATCSCLSNKQEYSSFFRTVPSDNFQVKAIIQIIKHYGWTWVGAIASDDDYGQYAIRNFSEEFKVFGCLSFLETLPKLNEKEKIFQIVNSIKQSSANVVVIFAPEVELMPLVQEIVHQNITSIQWIASEAWSTSTVLASKENFISFGGTIGVAVRRGLIPGLQNFLLQVQPDFDPDNNLSVQFWEALFDCQFQENKMIQNSSTAAGIKKCTGEEEIINLKTAYSDVSELRVSYNVYKAVYALAHALHNLMSCRNGKGPFEGKTCANIANVQPWQWRNLQFDPDRPARAQAFEFWGKMGHWVRPEGPQARKVVEQVACKGLVNAMPSYLAQQVRQHPFKDMQGLLEVLERQLAVHRTGGSEKPSHGAR